MYPRVISTLYQNPLAKVAFHLSVVAGRKEVFLASLNGKVEGVRVQFLLPQLYKFLGFQSIGVGELSASDSRAGSFWPESVLRT